MSKRTDTHSEDNFNPDEYRYHGFYESWGFLFGMNEEYLEYKRQLIARILDSHVDGVHGPGQCCHCGAHLRYVLVYHHVPTDSFVCFGETCAIHRLDVPLEEWEAFKADVKRKRGLAIEQGKGAAWREDHPEVVEFFQSDEWDEWLFYSMDFLSDMDATIRSKGRLTDPQLAATLRSIEKGRVHEAKARERDAEREIEKENAADVPNEKAVTVEGEVISVKYHENGYGGCMKMVVQDVSGFRVWGTVPTALEWLEIDGYKHNDVKGFVVRFVANLTQSDDDAKFGFFKRPRKSEVVKAVEVHHPTDDEIRDFWNTIISGDRDPRLDDIVGEHRHHCEACAEKIAEFKAERAEQETASNEPKPEDGPDEATEEFFAGRIEADEIVDYREREND